MATPAHTAMSDLWRLDDTVTGVEHKGLALILIHNTHPAVPAEDHLKVDPVVVDPVWHRSAVRDADVRGNEGTTYIIMIPINRYGIIGISPRRLGTRSRYSMPARPVPGAAPTRVTTKHASAGGITTGA